MVSGIPVKACLGLSRAGARLTILRHAHIKPPTPELF
mgnify:CR=1 FL=1